MMKTKENAVRTIKFNSPERVVGGPPTHGIGYRGCNHEGFVGGGHHLPVGSVWVDIWGTEWHREHDGVMGFPRGNPLANLPADLATYAWPDPEDERVIRQVYEQAKGWNREETFLMSDDLGTQCGLLLSPALIEEFLVPEYRRLFAVYKAQGVLVNFHSCGHIEPILDVFMRLGVDILNPVQATANNLHMVRSKTAGRMALQGGVSSGLIEAGPIPAIREEVHRRIWQLGRDGGYFCDPDQGMPWPEAHIKALRDAVEEFGTYPLQEFTENRTATEPESPGYGSKLAEPDSHRSANKRIR